MHFLKSPYRVDEHLQVFFFNASYYVSLIVSEIQVITNLEEEISHHSNELLQ